MPEDPGELGLSEADVPVIDVQHIGTFLCPECNRTMHGGMDPNFDPLPRSNNARCVPPRSWAR